MENFDRENIDELLEIRQIRQYFPPSKICAVRYLQSPIMMLLHDNIDKVNQTWHMHSFLLLYINMCVRVDPLFRLLITIHIK